MKTEGQESQSANVVSLFSSRKAADGESEDGATLGDDESFDNVMERNRKNKERVEKERLNANKSVLRSYRIKN